MSGDMVRERLTRVETELKNLQDNFKDYKKTCNDHFDEINDSIKTNATAIVATNKALNTVNTTIEKKLRGSLTGAEKASIIVALIMSTGSVIVAWIAMVK